MEVKTENEEGAENMETCDSTQLNVKVEKQSDTEDGAEVNNVKIKNPDSTIAANIEQAELMQENSAEESIEDKSQSTKSENPLKRKRCRPLTRKRKKLHKTKVIKPKEPVTDSVKNDTSEDTVDTSTDVCKEDKEYCLTVSNLPNSWSFMEIKNYIDTECGPVDEIEMIKDDNTSFGAIRLSYQDEEGCNAAMEKLKNKEVSGNKLVLEITVVNLDSKSETKSETDKKPWMPDLDSWEVDLQGMYGLKLQYLRSLGITPPLDKWVHVSNFRCDKTELRDVMELAGHVQMCSVFTVMNRYANVMYSHPLEAVQAVSMLHNQQFYGKQLKVAMDRSPLNTILLPRGLTNIGKGLGLNGKPLKNIVKHYERFVENKDCLINPAMFDIPEDHSMKLNEGFESVKFVVKSVEEFNYPITDSAKTGSKASTSTATPKSSSSPAPKPEKISAPPKKLQVQTPAFSVTPMRPTPPVVNNFTPVQRGFGPNFRPPFVNQQPMMNGQAMQGPQGPQGPPMGPPMGPMGPLMQQGPGPQQFPFSQQFPRPQAGPMRPGWGPGPGPMRPPGPNFHNEPVKLIISNLPPSTTFGLLCSKMSEWGHVVCIQLTTPGCAVVTFANNMQAEACLQHFNGRNIENHIIQMKYA